MPLAVGDGVRTGALSRAAIRLTDASVMRLNESTLVEIIRPSAGTEKACLDISSGGVYFFSRERPRSLEVRTPSANGSLRGTEFVVRVSADGSTVVTMLDGEVELSNSSGRVMVRSGYQGEARIGQAPRVTPALETRRIVQWVLHYPGVLDPRDLNLSVEERRRLAESLAAYQSGDLLVALERYPTGAENGGGTAIRVYRAALLLAVGRVENAQKILSNVPSTAPGRRALERIIAVVNHTEDPGPGAGAQTAGEWLADSYSWQALGNLEKARESARKATVAGPEFGFAWVRLAQMEFSFGRIPQAQAALDRGLALSPRNAAGFALKGFLLSAENRIDGARAAFDEAIRIDGSLGQAWLGRGLTCIRQRRSEEGRRDLQTAATLEPNQSILRSYLGKAFSQVGDVREANREFKRAKELDPKDPTPWLYSAIEAKQENRYNQAVQDLEESVALNDNRQIFRSKYLLDQDLSIRGTNLAAIYQNDGMPEQGFREAVRAVNYDYSSAPAHLFLANSYNALRDPYRILLRYETPWFNELLLSNLLSPVGGGPLSQFVSEQEYSKMFQQDGFGVSSTSEYFSSGAFQETASQYGTSGNISYAVDTQYLTDPGQWPNSAISRLDTFVNLKYQLGLQDSLLFQAKFENLNTGNLLQNYDNAVATSLQSSQTSRFHENDSPGLLLLSWHHEWAPGQHSLLVAGRIASHQTQSALGTTQTQVGRDIEQIAPTAPFSGADLRNPAANPAIQQELQGLTDQGTILNVSTAKPLNSNYDADFAAYTVENQQILTFDSHTLVAGARYQTGQFGTANEMTPQTPNNFFPLVQQDDTVGLERISAYVYDTWEMASWLSVTGGGTYDRLIYPENFRNPPINDNRQTLARVSPKIGCILQPAAGTVIRAAWTQSISGASFDESVRLEPTQVAGFTQAFRTLASESLLGSVAGSRYSLLGVSLEQKLPTRTYLGLEYNNLQQRLDRTVGVFDNLDSFGLYPREILPSSIAANDIYREHVVTATVNQLVGEEWSFSARYRYYYSTFSEQIPEFQAAALQNAPGAATAAEYNRASSLSQITFAAFYNHPCGFFATAEVNGYMQDNQLSSNLTSEPGDGFWQMNAVAGYRFYRNQCEVSAGLLNMTNTDYMLDPLNPILTLPRDRTLVLRAKFSF